MDALEYARQLVGFESTSVLSNVAVTDHVEKLLRQLDFSVERIEFDDANGVHKANVIGKKGRGLGGMAYFGHTDVVPADPWLFTDHGPFQPTVKEGRLYGRGSCDMKGSIACMLAAAGRFSAAELKRPIYITCTADEEVGYNGASQVAARSDFFAEMVRGDVNAVIGEPTELEVVYAHKGTYGFRVISHGRAAHSSTDKGVNANLAMIPFLVEMKRMHDELQADPAWQNPEFNPPTVSWNIGINDHTKAVNITAPQSICTVYFRPMPGMDCEVLLQQARQAAEKCGLEFKLATRGQPVYVDPKSGFVQDVLQQVGKQQPRTVAYGTDGAMLTALKKMVVFGPGSINQAHTHDEYIDLKQLELGTEMYARLIRHWCT
jgi:acetylornithine deacetylase